MSPGITRSIRALVACSLLLCVTARPGRAAEEKVTYPDGSLHSRVLLDPKGKRQGAYTAYFPGGKKVQERARYDAGQLAGVREVFDEKGNLFSSADIVASVDAYMNDSDPSNIDRVGHRRWVLNPAMAKTGFGAGAHFSAMYSFDGSRKDVPDYQFVAYPPAGLCPHDLFSASYAWHVSFNPEHYKVGPDVKAAIYPVDLSLRRAAQPLELNYHKVNLDGFGVPNAVIFRPKTVALRPDLLYEVVVTGLRERGGEAEKDGKTAEVSYFVSFF